MICIICNIVGSSSTSDTRSTSGCFSHLDSRLSRGSSLFSWQVNKKKRIKKSALNIFYYMYHLPCPVSKYWNLCKICDYCRVAAISRWCVHICHVYSRRPHILFPHRNILLDVRRRWEKFISRSCDDLTHNQQLHVWDTVFLPFFWWNLVLYLFQN